MIIHDSCILSNSFCRDIFRLHFGLSILHKMRLTTTVFHTKIFNFFLEFDKSNKSIKRSYHDIQNKHKI